VLDPMSKRPPYLELLVSAILLAVTVGFTIWAYQANEATRIALGVPLAVLTGALLLFVTYFAQIPRFEIVSGDDKYNPEFDDYYLHLKVKNTSWGFLGGAIAANCRATITVGGKDYAMKWANEPEPMIVTGSKQVGQYMVPTGIPQSWLIALAEVTEVPAGEFAVVDVAMRSKGRSTCYIHEAKNYWAPDHKRNPLEVGDYPFTLTITCRGRPPSKFEFVLNNDEGASPDLLKVSRPDGSPV
jgi:hypothetical protein